ncbi:MAG: hypothetical protein OXC11_06700 [Rhodospirillales bacterium]|nr:hypothetical protein [Rhodospirillales bacterium]
MLDRSEFAKSVPEPSFLIASVKVIVMSVVAGARLLKAENIDTAVHMERYGK